jgi:hypothetical protein
MTRHFCELVGHCRDPEWDLEEQDAKNLAGDAVSNGSV